MAKNLPLPIDVFSQLKAGVLNLDPVAFIENNLSVDGERFKINGNGYKPFADIYRYIGLKAVERRDGDDMDNMGKPVVLVKGRQVGATTMAAALECYFMACSMYGKNGKPPMRIMHLFPTLAMAAAYSKSKLNNMISTSRPIPGVMRSNGTLKSFVEAAIDKSDQGNDNLLYKKFLGENELYIESTGLDGDRIRGRTVDAMFFDEVQDTPQVAIGAATKLLTKAQHGKRGQGIQVFFGTPKQKGTAYYQMWKTSSQQYYHLKCSGCEEYFPLYRPDVNWEEIWLYGYTVRCTHCKFEQDKRIAAESGKWISMNPDKDVAMIGFHINQLYIPEFTKEDIVRQKPEKDPINTERLYQNEVLGEFYDGEGATISIEEIHDKCADPGRRFAKQLAIGGNKAYVGFDWGQRGNLEQLAGRQKGQSYSCAVVITVPQIQLIQIEYATRLTRVDPGEKIEVVEEMFRRYGAQLAVGDIGDAFDLTHILQRKYPERFLASRAMAKIHEHIRYRKDQFPKEIQFERDYYISELMGLLKSGNVRFPYGSYEEIMWLVKHCSSMEVKITMNKSGDPKRTFIKGPSPNDGFMALLNAYLAYKFDITQGFSIAQPAQMKFGKANSSRTVLATLGYAPFVR